MTSASLMRGASRGVLKCGARPVAVPRSGLRLQTPEGGPRDLGLRVTMTRASYEVGARSRRECRTTASTGPGRKIATVERREAGVLAENAGRRKHGARASVVTRTTGCYAAPGRLSALRHPLIGVANRKSD